MRKEAETWKCENCGEEWIEGGDGICPFCGSGDTQPVEDVPPDTTNTVK